MFGTQVQAAQPRPAGTVTRQESNIKGLQRAWILYIPRNLPPGAPLLFMFHGSGGDGLSTREVTGYRFDMLADQYKFIVAYPDGYETTWNDCRKGSPQPARVMNIDDESFIEAIIAKTASDYRIDRKRVFAAGHSNGGQLTYRLAMERPQEFAGIAAISASIPTPDNLACTPSDMPIPAMVINGTADPINPFAGGMVTLGSTRLGTVTSTRATAEYFAKINGQTGAPVTVKLPHGDARDSTWVDQSEFSISGKFGEADERSGCAGGNLGVFLKTPAPGLSYSGFRLFMPRWTAGRAPTRSSQLFTLGKSSMFWPCHSQRLDQPKHPMSAIEYSPARYSRSAKRLSITL
jgi:polyhydroxybutyrate depolymerase